MLGYEKNPHWRDMSDFVVHFTKPSPSQDAYWIMLSILHSGTLLPGQAGFGIARKEPIVSENQRSVCFSEIPLDQLERLSKKRSRYGIGFRKNFITKQGGGPIWYVQFGSPAHTATKQLMSQALKSPDPQNDPILKLTPFIDVKGSHFNSPYNYMFDWEREWRLPGSLTFTPEDVAILFIPAELHIAARSFFHSAVQDNTGPGYFCPYLDTKWTSEQIEKAFDDWNKAI